MYIFVQNLHFLCAQGAQNPRGRKFTKKTVLLVRKYHVGHVVIGGAAILIFVQNNDFLHAPKIQILQNTLGYLHLVP